MTGYATGNRVQKAVDNDPIDTNGDGEITTADTPAFDVFTNYTFNAGDQLIEEVVTDAVLGTTTHDYDGTQNVGKTEYEPDGSVKSQTRMSYDLQGRLEVTEVSQYSDGVVQSRSRSTYDYDATGIRVAALRQIDADGDGTFESTTDVRFLVDHANHTGYQQVIRESHLDAAGNLIKTIDYTFGHDELHQTVKEIDASTGDITSSRTDFFLHDGHGDVRALLNAAGAVATIAGIEQAFYYDAYGQLVNMAATAAATTLLYSGEQTDALTGQQYLRARYYNPNTGQFNRLDDFFGNHQDPQSFHKYAYVHGDPVQGVDPSGQNFSATGLAVTVSIGATIGAGAQVLANHALGQPLLNNVGFGAIFGGVALPLSILFPALGIGIAAYAIGGASYINYQVWTNPTTIGQKGSAAVLLLATTVGGRAAYKNYQTFGWRNTQGVTQVGKFVRLSKDSPLSEWLKGTPDDAMIHISPRTPSTLRGGIFESAERPGWVRFGDVKHLTPEAYRTGVVGPLAGGHSPKATTFAIRMPSPKNAELFFEVEPDIVNVHGVTEFETHVTVTADAFMIVPKGDR